MELGRARGSAPDPVAFFPEQYDRAGDVNGRISSGDDADKQRLEAEGC